MGEAGRLLLIGLVLGIGASLALSRYAEGYLFGLEANDGATLAWGCLLLTLTAFLAVAVPVRRATGLDPASVPADVHPVQIAGVGRYAIQITWSDGHASGIYPFRRLRALADEPAEEGGDGG